MSENINVVLNRCFMRFDDRAERLNAQQIVDTFVAVGPMLDVLANRSHQIIYGRRGVGKTHALRYFESQANKRGDLAIYIDCGNIGSNNSTYNDATLSTTERATRLMIDVCASLHSSFLNEFTDPRRAWSLSEVGPLLDDFILAISEVQVEGPVKQEKQIKVEETSKTSAGLGIKIKPSPELAGDVAYLESSQESAESKECHEGNEVRIVNFQFLMRKTSKIAEYVAPKRVWLLIDEWSTVPLDLQPHLADLLRRSFFSIPNVSVKIAAIEQRSAFKSDRSKGGYIGIELGADASVALNLDDYLVYDSNQERSIQVFRRLIRNHVISICNEDEVDLGDSVYGNWTSYAFTQDNVFVELVKACEGVPRDAMHILQNAAQRTPTAQISAPVLRYAALQFFQVEKDNAISSNPMNRRLLDWIRFKVIDQRNTRAFLLRVGIVDKLIDNLFDLRALHILSRSVSAAHRPGERYVVYKIDYGCYVDLTNTDMFPSGGLFADDPSFEINFDVPDDDRRSYRRAILDLDEFYKSF